MTEMNLVIQPPLAPGRVRGDRRRTGQALVEFAIILPVFLFLMLMAIDFGRLFFSYIQISNAAREGAAYAAGDPTGTAKISAHAQQETSSQAQGGESAIVVTTACADPAGSPILCSASSGGSGAGNSLTVKVSEGFTFITPFINGFFGNSFRMSASASAAVLGLAPTAAGGPPPGCSPPPVAAFTPTISGLTVNLDASASTPGSGPCAIASYAWDMGDGANPFPPVVGRTTSYTYAFAGTYPIILTVSNSNATPGTITQIVTVSSAVPTPTPTPTATPTATPTPTPTPVCGTVPTFTSAFTGQGNGVKAHEMSFYGAAGGQPAPLTWNWSFGDASIAGGQNVVRDYGSAGTYTVSLTVINGTCQVTTSHQVTAP